MHHPDWNTFLALQNALLAQKTHSFFNNNPYLIKNLVNEESVRIDLLNPKAETMSATENRSMPSAHLLAKAHSSGKHTLLTGTRMTGVTSTSKEQ